MKKISIKNLFIFLIIFFFIFCLFKYPETCLNSALNGLKICGNILIPSLLPFLIISTFAVKSNVFSGGIISRYLSEKLLNLPSEAFLVIIMSLTGGYPVGMKLTSELFRQGEIDEKQAKRLGLFCVNAGPAFVINAVGVSLLGSKKAGIIIFVSVTLSALLIAFISRFFIKSEIKSERKINTDISLTEALVQSVSDSTKSMISICAWVIFITTIVSVFKQFNPEIYFVLSGISEVTSGCALLYDKVPLFVIAGLIGFGGLCVHCQILSDIHSIKMKVSSFYVGRISAGILSAILCKIILNFFPCDMQTFSNLTNTPIGTLNVSIPAVCSLLFMCGLMILDLSLDRCKKIC